MACPFSRMPGPWRLPVFGSVLTYSPISGHSFERLHVAKKALRSRYGDIYRERLGPVNLVQLFTALDFEKVYRLDGKIPARPPVPLLYAASQRDNLGLGMGSLNGQEWYEMRRAVQKLLLQPKTATAFLPLHNTIADDFISLIQDQVGSHGKINDMAQLILKFTLETIGLVCFNVRLGCLDVKARNDDIGKRVLACISVLFETVQKTTFAFPWYALFRTPAYRRFVKAKKEINDIAQAYISEAVLKQERCGMCPKPGDLLGTLVSKAELSNDQIVALITDLFIAGIDSTANTLCFVLYNLARNPEKQEILATELHHEMKESLTVTSEMIERLVYMRACVKESFRLSFPVEGGPVRELQVESEFSGYGVPKGTLLSMNNQTLCLDANHFPEPERFLPERWLKDSVHSVRSQVHPYAMLPFGHGPRACIGRRFAEQEIYLALAKIIFHYQIHHDEEEPIGMLNRVFNAPDRLLNLTFTNRHHNSV